MCRNDEILSHQKLPKDYARLKDFFSLNNFQMTAKHGYVWFLPNWLSMKTIDEAVNSSISSCTKEQLREAINGHFSLQHAPYAQDDVVMQENKTVAEWKVAYKNECKNSYSHSNKTYECQSDYAGYTYDAVWVYALALNQLVKEDPSYLRDLHSENTTKRLMEVIKDTDFIGVSGRIRFGEGGSRFSVINVLQWIEGQTTIVGTYHPNVSELQEMRYRKFVGGKLVIYKSNITWLYSKGIPSDGTEVCVIGGLAGVLNLDCKNATYFLVTFVCLLVVILVSLASFMFWKRRYDHKLKKSAKVMRTFGIDLLSQSSIPSNSLDKWEVPKERVVINRRLGEGAFGTVYGGEAQINDQAWTAVAVKTLKMGSTIEDRLDFLSEAESMKRFDHRNIVKLLGVCLQTEPIYTIMEYMLYGDLKTYLLARRHLVGEKIADDSDISPKRLTTMVLDISKALSYLASHKYVHRDVACRNCLVNAQRMVKLADFGMARPMFESDYYKFNRKGMLPVRWMAPESLGLGIFTPASDVWSFAVLLYEIITFGSYPFQGLTNNQVLEHIKAGNTLPIPSGVKPHLEGLMKACWNSQYKKRPTASEIAEFVGNYPRLITPCLDVPLASVQMAETESDELELLPGFRKLCNLTPPTMNGLIKSSEMNNFDETTTTTSTLPNGITLRDFNVPPDVMFSSLASNAYNPIEPLLKGDAAEDISRSSLSLRRYVPMCGFKRSNRSLYMDTSNL